MFNIWHIENIMAYALTSKPENINTNVMIQDIRKPRIEQARKPIIRCCRVSFGQICSSEDEENMLSFG